MNINDILSIGRDTLDSKNVRIMLRLLGTFYYLSGTHTNITHKMLVDKNILPLYRTIVDTDIYDDIDSYNPSQLRRLNIILIVLMYTILLVRYNNSEWDIYRREWISIPI
jgi:hypothetical protein